MYFITQTSTAGCLSFTFPNVLPGVCIHRGGAVFGYFEFAKNESGLSDFSEAGQVPV
jgi:hypothetical protein